MKKKKLEFKFCFFKFNVKKPFKLKKTKKGEKKYKQGSFFLTIFTLTQKFSYRPTETKINFH